MSPAQTAPVSGVDPLLEPTLARCRQLLAQGQVDPALALARELLAVHPDNYKGLGVMGQAHMARHDYDAATAVFRRMAQERPNDPTAHNSLGLALLMGGRPEEAKMELEQAVRLNPGSATYQTNLGKLLMMQEDWLAALERLQEAAALAPPNKREDIEMHLANCRANLGLPEQTGFVSWQPEEPPAQPEPPASPAALEQFTAAPAPEPAPAVEPAPSKDELQAKVKAQMDASEFIEASQTLRRLVEMEPGEPHHRNSLGVSLLMAGKSEEAVSELELAVEGNPASATYRGNLGQALAMVGSWEEAKEQFVMALATANERQSSVLNEMLAACRQALGQPQEPVAAPASSHPQPAGFTRWTPPEDEAPQVEAQAEAQPVPQAEAQPEPQPEPRTPPAAPPLAARALNILFVQEAPCIRNYKMASALKARGHRVSLAWTRAKLSQMYKGLSDEIYDECIQLTGWPQLWDLARDYDLVHCHNEPDLPTVAALGARVPVIHDTHDLISLRHGGDPNLAFFEGLANRGATGRVYTTRYQLEEATRLYGVDGPSLVLMNYASAGDLPKALLPKLSAIDGRVHMGYEGGIGGNTHRDFLELFAALAEAGLVIHIHPNGYDPGLAEHFRRWPNIRYYQPVSPKEIMERLSAYDVGIIPFNLVKGNRRFLDSTVANKLFEYLAAGLPVVTSDLASYRDYFAKNPVGFTFQDAGDLLARLPGLLERTKGMDLTAFAHTYEGEVERLEEFYYRLLEAERPQGSEDPTGRPSEAGTQTVAPAAPVATSLWAGPRDDLGRAIAALHQWVAERDYAGYDPYDLPSRLLTERLAGRITSGQAQAMLQRQHSDPLGLRRELGIRPAFNAKAMGLFASSYALLDGRLEGIDLAPGRDRCLEWLLANPTPGLSGLCWGYPFDWESVVMIPADTPTGVISYHCGDAFWAMWRNTGRREWLDRCLSVATFMAADLNQDKVAEDALCFSYTPLDFYHVHNASLCVSEFLIRLGQAADRRELSDLGRQGLNFAMRELTPQGYLTYWAKGFEPAPANVGQMDHYHTAAELRSLLRLTPLLPHHAELDRGLERYLEMYLRDFFDGPMPKLHPKQTWPLDIHAAAEAAYVLGEAAPRFPQAAAKLLEFIPWFLATCVNEDGSFLYRIYRQGESEQIDRTPYMRWGQAWSMRGLTAAWLAADELMERG